MRSALAVLAALLALGAAAAAPAATAPSRVQVVAREFSFALSRPSVKQGEVIVELVNMGQDPHDLRIARAGARHVAGTPVVAPGGRIDLTLRLRPGRYSLWCSVADHRELGMRATLVVTR